MGDKSKFITGLLAGLGLAFILDPDRGSRRRALLRDKATHTGRKLAEGVEATTRDLRNRAQGAAAEVRSRLRSEEAGDEILHERVRSAIGRVVSQPNSITVTAHQGRVTLQGSVPERELDGLIRAAEAFRGVGTVVNELEVHRDADVSPATSPG
jgi:osmotically-inducible protein OsmY